jgi:flagellar biogenesis protein FliO
MKTRDGKKHTMESSKPPISGQRSKLYDMLFAGMIAIVVILGLAWLVNRLFF